MDGSLPEMRIGDRERRRTDAQLQAALADGVLTLTEYDGLAARCWAARTRSELDVLTSDLRSPVEADRAPVRSTDDAGPGIRDRVAGGVVTAALVGAGLFTGIAVLGAEDGASLFGSRTVQVGPDQERVEVGTLFGSTEIVVPDDARVRMASTVVFGSVNCDQACAGSGTREVVVDARGGFGSVDIVTESEAAREG